MDDKKVIDIRNNNDNELAKMQKQSTKNMSWQKYFMYKVNNKGEYEGLKSTSKKNVLLILNNDKHLKGLFKYNEFTQNVDVSRDETIDLTKFGAGKISFNHGSLRDIDINNLGVFFESYPDYHVTFKSQLISDAVDASAAQHLYNPVVDYMNNCLKNWDHKKRIDDFLPTYLGADKNEINTLIIHQWLMGAVAKAYNPNTKFDLVLDLVGGQGAGKTTLLRKLAPLGLYTDQFNRFDDKDDFEVMKNALIVNDDEMTASNKSSFEIIKKFITMQVFEYRKSYGRHAERFPKKFVISRTTNEIQHLKDRSGDRRFMSILVNKDKQKKHPVTDLDSDYINQIWGEAVYLFKQAKHPFDLTDKQEKLLSESRENFVSTTELEEQLRDILDDKFPDYKFIETKKLAFQLYGVEDGFMQNRKDYQTIKYYMEHMGYKETRIRRDNKRTRGFVKS